MREDTTTLEEFLVVVNDEEQYSIWPTNRVLPNGWKKEGYKASKEQCMAYIDEVWKDMRPKSLREKMNSIGSNE